MRTKRTVVILISGKAQAGKTTTAEILIKKLDESLSIMKYGFADPLKYIAKAFLGWDGNKDERGRKLLQDIGRLGREYDQDIWVKHLLNQMDKVSVIPKNFVLVDDWRYPNELAYLKKNPVLDIVTIRLFGRGGLNGEVANDTSENSLPEATEEQLQLATGQMYDFTIDNSRDKELLEHKLDIVLAEISKQYIVE